VQPSFLRGDSNGDGQVDIADPIATLCFLFLGTTTITCQDSADANDSGTLDLSDAVTTLGCLFLGSPPTLPSPYPARGPDPTPDELGCDSY